MNNLFKKIDTVFVTVTEMESAVEWYSNCLGLKPIWQDQHISVMGTGGETPVTIIQQNTSEEEHPLFNFLTDDIEKAHQHLREKGVKVDPITETDILKTFDFLDPEGNRLNVCWLKESK